jgi:hypothetical protein
MDLTKVSRNDWIVVGGFVAMFIGTLGPWYGVHIDILGERIGGSVNGWHGSYLGWLTFLLCLAAASIAVRKAVLPSLQLPLPDALIVMGCGVLSLLFVLIRLLVVPSGAGREWGIWLSLIAAAVVSVGGLLKNSEPAS